MPEEKSLEILFQMLMVQENILFLVHVVFMDLKAVVTIATNWTPHHGNRLLPLDTWIRRAWLGQHDFKGCFYCLVIRRLHHGEHGLPVFGEMGSWGLNSLLMSEPSGMCGMFPQTGMVQWNLRQYYVGAGMCKRCCPSYN